MSPRAQSAIGAAVVVAVLSSLFAVMTPAAFGPWTPVTVAVGFCLAVYAADLRHGGAA